MFRPKLHELARGSQMIIYLSEYDDDNGGDDVKLTVNLTDKQA